MAVSAALKFTQGVLTATDQAIIVALGGGAVTIENDDDTDVSTWTYELLARPIDSALTPGVLEGPGVISSTTLAADVDGVYRIKLTVTGVGGSASTVKSIIVRNSRGWIIPSLKSIDTDMDYDVTPGVPNVEGWQRPYAEMIDDIDVQLTALEDAIALIEAADTLPVEVETAAIGVATKYARMDHGHVLGAGPHGNILFAGVEASDALSVNGGTAFFCADDGIGMFGASVEAPAVYGTTSVETPLVHNGAGAVQVDGLNGVELYHNGNHAATCDLSSGVSRFVGQGASGSRIEAGSGSLDLRGATGVSVSHSGNELCTFTRNGSNQVVQTVSSSRVGYGFEAPAASQYIYFRCHSSGSIYLDSETLNWRSAAGTTEYLRCEVSSGTRIVGIPARTTNGTGANLRLRPQPVAAGRGALDTPGSLEIDLGQCLSGGDLTSGRIYLRDEIGTAVTLRLRGLTGEGSTYAFAIEGAPSGGGRARNVGLELTSGVSVALAVAGNTDLTLSTTSVNLRYASTSILNATVNGQAIGGSVEAAQNGALRLAHTGVPSAAATAGVYLWTANGQLRARDQRNVLSEVSTQKVSTTVTPSGPTRCYDRSDDLTSTNTSTTQDLTLIPTADLPAGGTWVMRIEVQWSAYDTVDNTVAGGTRVATIKATAGTVTVVTSAANQIDGTDDNTSTSVSSGAAIFVRSSLSGEIQIRFATLNNNNVRFHGRIVSATLWQH